MRMICANEFRQLNSTDTPRCIASWAHTQDQVLYSIYLLVALVGVAVAWMMASRRQRRTLKKGEIGFSLSYRRWARTSRAAIIINRPVQLVVSFVILVLTLTRLSSYEVSSFQYHLTTFLYLISIVDDTVRFLAARYKLLYCVSPLTLLQLLCLASHFEVGYGPTKIVDGVISRTWLDFSIMRPVFILRSYSEMERHVPVSTKGWMMARLAVKILLMIGVGSTVMFFLETLGEMPFFQDNGFAHLYACNDGAVTRNKTDTCSSETWSIMFSFYFTVVTLGTVGYGDNAPKTVLSRLLAIMFIVIGIILFSMEIENLINLYKLRQIGNPPYTPKPDTEHVVIMGNPSFAQLSAILRELFHEDHVDADSDLTLQAVILGDRQSKFTKELIAKLEVDPIFASRVTYIAGNATRAEDLERAFAADAKAIFVFPNKLSDDPSNEDALNIMRVLSAKRYCGPSVRFLVMVLRAENARHMLAAGVGRDDVICENVIKMGVLAQSALAHGTSTMIANLASSLSVDTNEQQAPNKHFRLPLKVKEKSAAADFQISAMEGEINRTGNIRSYVREYYEGAGKEMYLIHLSKKYAGMTFAQTASQIFRETCGSVVLIAVEVILSSINTPETDQIAESRVLLNPGQSLIITEWMQCYVIADDLEHIFDYRLCPDEITKDELIRSAQTPTLLAPMSDSFLVTQSAVSNLENSGDELHTLTAYASMTTPHHISLVNEEVPPAIRKRRDMHTKMSAESVMMDHSLKHLALDFGTSFMCGSIYDDTFTSSQPRTPETFGTLDCPPLSVLLDPKHIVVCSFLGEESLISLQWLLLPLRGSYGKYHPPITILDAAEPSPVFIQTLSAYNDVYYVRGSPLVYSELQRAGAKSAAAVIVLGKRTSSTAVSSSASEAALEASIVDAEAIFTTMLVELKMDFSRIFTITELADDSNSKFMGMSYQLKRMNTSHNHSQNSGTSANFDSSVDVLGFWDTILSNDTPQQKSEQAIFGLPLFMSGRLLHPELCENMVVQTFYNPSIHKIIRQFVGGPRCTGVIRSFSVPRRFRKGCTYGELFHGFASSKFAGICLGVYRLSALKDVELPIVITAPHPDFEILDYDEVFVLIGIHTFDRAAMRIQRFYRKCKGTSERKPLNNLFFHSSISKYLESQSRRGTDADVSPEKGKSLYAEESNGSFTSYYV